MEKKQVVARYEARFKGPQVQAMINGGCFGGGSTVVLPPLTSLVWDTRKHPTIGVSHN
jgi:hypothetical protein